jgi:hypothetical protein
MKKKIISALTGSLVFVSIAFAQEVVPPPAYVPPTTTVPPPPAYIPPADTTTIPQAAPATTAIPATTGVQVPPLPPTGIKPPNPGAYSAPIKEVNQAARSARQEVKNIRPAMASSSASQLIKEQMEKIRETRKNAIGQIQEDRKNAIEVAKTAFEKAREQAKNATEGIKGLRDQLKKATSTTARKEADGRIIEQRMELGKNYFGLRSNNLSARMESLHKTDETLDRVLTRLEENSVDTVSARALLSIAQAKIDIAAQKVSAVKTLIETLSSTLTKETIKDYSTQVKNASDEASKAIEEARKDLSTNVIPEVRKLTPQKQAPANEATSTNEAQ